jgi:hypothetical protein
MFAAKLPVGCATWMWRIQAAQRAEGGAFAVQQQDQERPHPRYVPLLRHALRAGFAVRFGGILPSQSAPSPATQGKEK